MFENTVTFNETSANVLFKDRNIMPEQQTSKLHEELEPARQEIELPKFYSFTSKFLTALIW